MLSLFVGFLVLSASALVQLPDQAAPIVSRDHPSPESAYGSREQGLDELDPRSVLARAKFPEAKRRFLKGLPRGYKLYVLGEMGGIPKVVEKIESGRITGRWPESVQAADYETIARTYIYLEEDIADWAIVRPNGITEEGDFTGISIRDNFRMTSFLSGDGATCDDARHVLDSAVQGEAESICIALDARLCRDNYGVFTFGACQWNKDIQAYRVSGLGVFGCCL